MATTAYPFDPTGVAATNKIVGEQHIITAPNFRDFHFVVPTFGPFFAQGLVVKHRDTNNVVRTLVEGIDYYTTHWFISASRGCARPIYGSISFLDLTLTGVIIVDYQTLGGIWTQTPAKIAEILADIIHNPRITAFDVVIDMPISFPVIDHEWDLADMVGMSDVVASLNTIEDALRVTGAGGISDHIADLTNPHQVSKAQVGLGSVQNYPPADGPTTTAGTSAVHYVTPFSLKAALDAGPTAAINAHTGNLTNPHGTTAAQVGAYTQAQTNTLLGQKLGVGATAFDTFRFDGKSPTEYRDWALLGTAANSLKFNGFTYGDAKIDILSGTAANAGMLEGRSYSSLMLEVAGSTVDNALHFGGYTPALYKVFALDGTAANAAMFDNKTASQWEAHLGLIFGTTNAVARQVVQPATTGEAVGDRWIELGRAFFPDGVTFMKSEVQDLHWLITGGDSADETTSPVQILRISTRGAPGSEISTHLIDLHGSAIYGSIGYTEESVDTGGGVMADAVRVWFRTKENHGSITVTELARGGRTALTGEATPVTVEPVGITYITTNLEGVASVGFVNQLRTDVEGALQQLTTAFNDLKAQIEAA